MVLIDGNRRATFGGNVNTKRKSNSWRIIWVNYVILDAPKVVMNPKWIVFVASTVPSLAAWNKSKRGQPKCCKSKKKIYFELFVLVYLMFRRN